jgi:endoglucanase
LWDSTWGYLAEQSEAPVALTAFGTAFQNDADKQWFGAIVDYVAKHELNFAYWTLNPDSGDTGGLLQYDWITVETDKVNVLKPLLVQDPKLTVTDAGL